MLGLEIVDRQFLFGLQSCFLRAAFICGAQFQLSTAHNWHHAADFKVATMTHLEGP